MTTQFNMASNVCLFVLLALLTIIWFAVKKLNKSRKEEGIIDDEIEMDAPNTNRND